MGVTLIQFLNLSDTLENLFLKKNVVIGKILLIKIINLALIPYTGFFILMANTLQS